jgi:cytochrome c biogenesis protein CcmG/thiol:disulfide interchange protein DsbE
MRFVCILILIGAAAACQPAPSPPDSTPDAWYAPDFGLSALDGTQYKLSDLRGQWVILNFWATWCVPCVTEMPALQAIADEYAGQVILLGINVRESREDVAAFALEHNIRFPLLLNADDATLLNYQVIGLPQTVVISPTGEIVDRRFGPLELDEFSQSIERLLSGSG